MIQLVRGVDVSGDEVQRAGSPAACSTTRSEIMTRVMKAVLVVMATGIVGTSNNSAEAFWGHHRGYAPVAAAPVVSVPVTAAYYPAAPLVAFRRSVCSPPLIGGSA